jgi:hypothetical protein
MSENRGIAGVAYKFLTHAIEQIPYSDEFCP